MANNKWFFDVVTKAVGQLCGEQAVKLAKDNPNQKVYSTYQQACDARIKDKNKK